VLLGDADDPSAASEVAAAKGRPQAKGVALVCPRELLGEHVNLQTPALGEAIGSRGCRPSSGARMRWG
jgi:hypothetical protein